jgi:ribulose-phosphate 3-epimerase
MGFPLRISPSILSADFAKLGEEIRSIEAAGADWIHVDVMDGRFVPNLTIGPPVVAALRKCTTLPLDVHLMMVEPERFVDAFAQAGADHILVHVEAGVNGSSHLHRTLAQIRALGKKAGVVLNPHSSEAQTEYLLGSCDIVLLMSVNPGFGGQKFIASVLTKIERLAQMRARQGLSFEIEIDGGVSADNAASIVAAGANVLVAGAAAFQGGPANYGSNIQNIRTAANGVNGG